MLHAAFVRSPHPHARVTRVDAAGLPAGCVALLPEDVADLGRYGCQARDQRVLADVARHAGDVVAAVAAPTRAAARAAAKRVEVDYEELPAVFDPVQAVAPGAPLLHADTAESAQEAVSIGVRPLPGTNVCHRFRLTSGDAAAAMARADVVVARGLPHPERRPRPDGAPRRRRRVGGRPAHAVDRHADAVQHARRPRRPLRRSRPRTSGSSSPMMGGSFGAKTFVRTEAVARRARAQGRPPRQGRARPHGGVPHAQPPPGDDARPPRRDPGRHARRQGARLLGRHGRVRRLRPGRRDEARLRRRRPVPDPARAGRLARDLHEPAAQRRLPRLRRDAVDLRERAGDGHPRRAPRHEPARAAPAQPAARRRPLRHRRGHARRPLRGVPAGRGRRRRLRGGPARQGPVRAAQGHADAEPRADRGRAHAGRLRGALRVDGDGPGRAALDPADGRAAARLRAGPGRGPRARHGHHAVRHADDVEPLART